MNQYFPPGATEVIKTILLRYKSEPKMGMCWLKTLPQSKTRDLGKQFYSKSDFPARFPMQCWACDIRRCRIAKKIPDFQSLEIPGQTDY